MRGGRPAGERGGDGKADALPGQHGRGRATLQQERGERGEGVVEGGGGSSGGGGALQRGGGWAGGGRFSIMADGNGGGVMATWRGSTRGTHF